MNPSEAIEAVLAAHASSGKPLAIVLAGHNGSGKSTFWNKRLAPRMQVPLINADRMMLSILPEPENDRLPAWAAKLRDEDASWMKVAQLGVQAFVAQAMRSKVPFATETVFSYLERQKNGTWASKADTLRALKRNGYFTLLVFVGLTSAELSILRVHTRVTEGGHNVAVPKLRERFPRTQQAIGLGMDVANASLLVDNSRDQSAAFTPCRVEIARRPVFDIRTKGSPPAAITAWLDVVRPG